MKIIARTSDRGVLIETTEYEIANLLGYSSPDDVPRRGWSSSDSPFKVGTEIKVSQMFDQLWRLAREKTAMEAAAAKLEAVAALLRVMDPLIIKEATEAEEALKQKGTTA